MDAPFLINVSRAGDTVRTVAPFRAECAGVCGWGRKIGRVQDTRPWLIARINSELQARPYSDHFRHLLLSGRLPWPMAFPVLVVETDLPPGHFEIISENDPAAVAPGLPGTSASPSENDGIVTVELDNMTAVNGERCTSPFPRFLRQCACLTPPRLYAIRATVRSA